MIEIPVLELPFDFKPKADWVVIEPIDDPEMAKSRIIMPRTDPSGVPFIWGRVLAVGEGAMTVSGDLAPLAVSPGDVVWFAHTPGVWYRKNGKPLSVIQEQYIGLAVDAADFEAMTLG